MLICLLLKFHCSHFLCAISFSNAINIFSVLFFQSKTFIFFIRNFFWSEIKDAKRTRLIFLRIYWSSTRNFNKQVKFSQDSVRPACTIALHNHCGLSPGVTQPLVDFGACKMDALTGMKCTCEYGSASPAPLTETLNWLVSRVFSRTFMTLRRPTREEPVASANDFSSYVYDEIMRVVLRVAGNRVRVTLKTYRNETRRNHHRPCWLRYDGPSFIRGA